MRLYELTELGEGWGWGSRLAEIAVQTLSLIFVMPVVLFHNFTGWLLEKLFNS